jgi:hypothetical protein
MEASQTPGNEPVPGEAGDEQREGGHKLADPVQGQGGPLSPEGHKLATEAPASGAPDPTAAEQGLGGPAAAPAAPASEGAQAQVDAQAEVPDEDEANPARDQAPVATDAQEAIKGDPGLHEQQPIGNEGSPTAIDRPVATSAPPPSAQSGVPLPEDRAAGVEPGDAPAAQPQSAAGQS